MTKYKPLHLSANSGDLKGNDGINRYIFLTGTDERAKAIAEHFTNTKVKNHARASLYLGDLNLGNESIAVASIATGMGCPSIDIIVNELLLLGAKRFLRIGTAGSLQPNQVKIGDLVIASAAVRDDETANCYIMPGYPAVASLPMINMAITSSHLLNLKKVTHVGFVHTKSSFYAREMQRSYLAENLAVMQSLKKAGVLATEMECAQLFILASLFSKEEAVLAGAILAIVGDKTPISHHAKVASGIKRAIALGLMTILQLARIELNL